MKASELVIVNTIQDTWAVARHTVTDDLYGYLCDYIDGNEPPHFPVPVAAPLANTYRYARRGMFMCASDWNPEEKTFHSLYSEGIS